MIKLIVFDCYGTLVRMDALTEQRKGLLAFLKKHKDKIIVVATDDPYESRVWNLLEDNRIKQFFRKVYTLKDIDEDDCKDLDKIALDFNVKNIEMVFIGDNYIGRDKRSCEKFKVRFIRVPSFGIDGDFDFRSIEDLAGFRC